MALNSKADRLLSLTYMQ